MAVSAELGLSVYHSNTFRKSRQHGAPGLAAFTRDSVYNIDASMLPTARSRLFGLRHCLELAKRQEMRDIVAYFYTVNSNGDAHKPIFLMLVIIAMAFVMRQGRQDVDGRRTSSS